MTPSGMAALGHPTQDPGIPVDVRAVLACPSCAGALSWTGADGSLVCTREHIAYPVQVGVPPLLASES